MTNFIPKNDNGIATGDFECYPTELENSWIFIHKLKNHSFYSYVFSMYHNDDLKTGTIVVSPYFYHKYPDVHSLYCHQDKDTGIYFGVSGWVNPKHRRKGWWFWYGLLTRIIFWGNFNIYVDAGGDRDKKMESFYQKATHIIKQKNKIENDGRSTQPEGEMQRDVVYPYTWYNHRIGGKIEKENLNET
jgi:hypothetical protein